MKITPLEIRKKSFEKVTFGGYNKEEVAAFLENLSLAWEGMNSRTAELDAKLNQANAELNRLREIEASLLKALRKLDDTSTLMVEQAKKEAQLIVYEGQLKASQLLNDAKLRAKSMLQEANQLAYQSLSAMREELRQMDYNYRLIEKQKEMLISEMRNFVNDTLSKIDRIEAHKRMVFYEEEIKRANTLMNQNNEFIRKHLSEMEMQQPSKQPGVQPKTPAAPQTPQTGAGPAKQPPREGDASFFDMV